MSSTRYGKFVSDTCNAQSDSSKASEDIVTRTTDLNPIDKAPLIKGPVRPVRVKRSKDNEPLTKPIVPSELQKDIDKSGEKLQNRKKSKIAVLVPSVKKGPNGENKLASRNGSGTVSVEKQPVPKRSAGRHIHFSDEHDKNLTSNDTDIHSGDRKRKLKDKREVFRLSKSSFNSEHVSDELSPLSDNKSCIKTVATTPTRKDKTREQIPLKDLGKGGDSLHRNAVPHPIIKHTDQRDTRLITHANEYSNELESHRGNTHSSSKTDQNKLKDDSDHAKRLSYSPKEPRYTKSDTITKEKRQFKQTLPKQFLSTDPVSPNIEKSKSQQRLQNQSSTETSGLGETITSGFSSQESITSIHSTQTSCKTTPGTHPQLAYQEDQGIDLREDTTTSGKNSVNDTSETKTIDLQNVINGKTEPGNYNENIKSRFINKTGPIHVPTGPPSIVDNKERGITDKPIRYRPMKEQVDQHHSHFLGPTDQLNNNGTSKSRGSQPNSSAVLGNLDQGGSYNAATDFDALFQQSENLPPQQSMGLGIEQINSEWNRHTRASSIKSIRSNRSSQGSFRSRSGSTRRSRRFLGEKESKWMKWGQERRASFRRRLDKLEQPEPDVPPRPSTPIKKARQEGLMFIHPDLESKYISEEDINYIQRHRQQRLQTYKVIEKTKNLRYHHDVIGCRLTANDLNILTRFWEHRVFVRSRYISILLSFVTVVIYIISICSSFWITYPSEEVIGGEVHEGLLLKCRPDYIQGNNLEDVCDGWAHRVKPSQINGTVLTFHYRRKYVSSILQRQQDSCVGFLEL